MSSKKAAKKLKKKHKKRMEELTPIALFDAARGGDCGAIQRLIDGGLERGVAISRSGFGVLKSGPRPEEETRGRHWNNENPRIGKTGDEGLTVERHPSPGR